MARTRSAPPPTADIDTDDDDDLIPTDDGPALDSMATGPALKDRPGPPSGVKRDYTKAMSEAHARQARTREETILRLRVAGANWQQVADSMNMTVDSTKHAYARAMKNIGAPEAEQIRTLTNERLNALTMAIWQTATGTPEQGRKGEPGYKPTVPPDLNAGRLVVQIETLRARLFNLGAEDKDDEWKIIQREAQEMARRTGLNVNDLMAEAERVAKQAWR